MKYVTDDGWKLENIEPLKAFIESYDGMENLIYELKNCVRCHSLVEMRDKLLGFVDEMKESLEDIGDEDEVKEE